MTVDVVIPTCKALGDIARLLYDVRSTMRSGGLVIPTCLQASAAVNRNAALNASEADVVVMIDDDISNFPVAWDVTLANTLEAMPECVMVSARLMTPRNKPGLMLGHPPQLLEGQLWEVPSRELPTACIAIRRNELRFDEEFVGSGWEDTCYCAQLRQRYPDGKFIINSHVKVVHHNEMKNQGGDIFEKNKAHYISKWGPPR